MYIRGERLNSVFPQVAVEGVLIFDDPIDTVVVWTRFIYIN